MPAQLTSPAFKSGGQIPLKYSCHDSNVSPPLSWEGAPPGASGYALILEDPDAPSGIFTHWIVFNIPPARMSLPEAVPAQGQLGDGTVQGKNGAGKIGYFGPCPPPGKPHHYFFRLYAQDQLLRLKPGANREQVLAALAGHSPWQAELLGMFTSPG
jgi:Raf kinase inhibitor-like YbhB/YbcL family protein